MDKCKRTGYYWTCREDAGPSGFCDKHFAEKCCVCKDRPATKSCNYSAGNYLVCEEPLCDQCQHPADVCWAKRFVKDIEARRNPTPAP